MGLNIPRDLRAWQSWQSRRRGLRGVLGALRSTSHPSVRLAVRGASPQIVVALDSRSPSGAASLSTLLEQIEELAVVSSVHNLVELEELLRGRSGTEGSSGLPSRDVAGGLSTDPRLASIRAVVTAGHYLPAGRAASEFAARRRLPNVVVQHGLMTPFAPPLPDGAHVLAFSDADGAFWASGRGDVSWSVTGSQLLWSASHAPRTPVRSETPYFLGQLHGAELPRSKMAAATSSFWHESRAVYRPHPSEVDRLSRIQHRLWEHRGMEIDRTSRTLVELGAPVVAAFSTGILEAASAGMPAWSYFPARPLWIREFWDRYGISEWGVSQRPTPAPSMPTAEPASLIAEAVQSIADGGCEPR